MCVPPANRAQHPTPDTAPLLNPKPGVVLNLRFIPGPLNTYRPSILADADEIRVNNGNVCRGNEYTPPPPPDPEPEPDPPDSYDLTEFTEDGETFFLATGDEAPATLGGYVLTTCKLTKDGALFPFRVFIAATALPVPVGAVAYSLPYLTEADVFSTGYAIRFEA